MRQLKLLRWAAAVATLVGITAVIPSASAAYLTVYGGPTFAPPVSYGYANGVAAVNDAGTAVGTVGEGDGQYSHSSRAYRWSALGGPAVELSGVDTYTSVLAINNAGTAVGSSLSAPLRWEASSTAATELQAFSSAGRAVDINDSGGAVGHSGEGVGGVGVDRATLWNASSAARTLLSHPDGYLGPSYATAINSTGTIIGWSGLGGLRWSASGGPVEILDGIPAAINDAGTIVGFIGSPNATGNHAARWNPSSTTATELDGLGFSAAGEPYSYSYALDINNSGTAVGFASTPDGDRAVRWDATGVAATQLGTLSAFDGQYATYIARDINDAGAIVGHAYLSSSAVHPGPEPDDPFASEATAVLWGLDGIAVDLNTLIDPQSGWTLNVAQAISDTGWIVGRGTFDPDGPGGQPRTGRLFLMHLPSAVPEPSSLALLTVAMLAVLRRRRAAWRQRTAVVADT